MGECNGGATLAACAFPLREHLATLTFATFVVIVLSLIHPRKEVAALHTGSYVLPVLARGAYLFRLLGVEGNRSRLREIVVVGFLRDDAKRGRRSVCAFVASCPFRFLSLGLLLGDGFITPMVPRSLMRGYGRQDSIVCSPSSRGVFFFICHNVFLFRMTVDRRGFGLRLRLTSWFRNAWARSIVTVLS